jgi:hypothetical protein
MSLLQHVNSDWDFCFDLDNTGKESRWHLNKPTNTKKVELPHVWETEPDFEPGGAICSGFYFKKFLVEKGESSKRFFMRFDSIHHHAKIWLNGEELGEHMGGDTSFDLDASKFIRLEEENSLVVQVKSPDELGRINDRPSNELPLGALYKKAPFAGFTGSMHFLMGGRAAIQSLNCYPDYEADQVTIEVQLSNPKNYKAQIEFTLTNPDGESATLPKEKKMEKENDTYFITFNLQDAQVWSPEEPNLYTIEVNLLGSYAMSTRFGLRRVEMERCNLKINHRIQKIKGIHFQQIFPFYHSIPHFKYDLRQDLEQVKKSGFNLIRAGGAPLSNAVLDICDELGLLVLQETSCYNQKSNKEGLEELKVQLETLMTHQGSHPSIVAWGIGSENGSMALENGNKLLRFASEADPYRPIISNLNSVSLDSNGNDKIDLGKVYDPTETKIDPFESHKLHMALPLRSASKRLLSSYGSSKDAKAVNDGIHGGKSFWERYNYLKNELGGKILVDGVGNGVWNPTSDILDRKETKGFKKHSESQNLIELKNQVAQSVKSIGLWKDVETFFTEASKISTHGFTEHIKALRINTLTSGYILENWCDFGLNTSGLVDWYRQPKPILKEIQQLNQPVIVTSQVSVPTPYAGTSATVDLHLLNEIDLDTYKLQVSVKGPKGAKPIDKVFSGTMELGHTSLDPFSFPVGEKPGNYQLEATLLLGNKEVSKTQEQFYVPPAIILDSILGDIHFSGSFEETVSYASNPASKCSVVWDLASLEEEDVLSLFEKTKKGGTLVLGSLTPEDTDLIHYLELLPFDLQLFRSTQADLGSFHYLPKSKFLKDLPANCLMDHTYADVMPKWSIEEDSISMKGIEWYAGSIHLYDKDLGQAKVKEGRNIGVMNYGKGKIIFYQLDVFPLLGKSALADNLFYNLFKMA